MCHRVITKIQGVYCKYLKCQAASSMMAETERYDRSGVDKLLEAASLIKHNTTKNGINKGSTAQALLSLENDRILSNHTNHKVTTNVPRSDNESGCDQTSPMLNCLQERRGRRSFAQNTKFADPEFMSKYEEVRSNLEIDLITRTEKKPTLSPLDSFFMMLCRLKLGSSWEEKGFTFSLEKVILKQHHP